MHLAKKMALVDFNKCKPEQCAGGVCAAAAACKLKLLRQERPYEIPMPDPVSCRVCGDCVRACPRGAVQITG
jgi:heterodisulfide reductase subunit A-like polyferredoxin